MKSIRFFAAAFFAFLMAGASAQSIVLTPTQLATLCTAVKADSNANTARINGDTVALMTWVNGARSPSVLMWRIDLQPQEADEAATYTSYDSLAAGKRDSWALYLKYARSLAKNKNRAWITDVWGSATAGSVAEAVLQAGTKNASNVGYALGGNNKTTGTVTALDLTYPYTAPSSTADWLVQAENCN